MRILSHTLIGPFFLDGNFNVECYLHLLQNQPAIQNLVGENFNNVWLQQDGAPSHFDLQVRQFLNHTFPGK